MYGVNNANRIRRLSVGIMQIDFIACTTADAISIAMLAFGYPLCSSACTAREPGIQRYLNFHNTSRYIAVIMRQKYAS